MSAAVEDRSRPRDGLREPDGQVHRVGDAVAVRGDGQRSVQAPQLGPGRVLRGERRCSRPSFCGPVHGADVGGRGRGGSDDERRAAVRKALDPDVGPGRERAVGGGQGAVVVEVRPAGGNGRRAGRLEGGRGGVRRDERHAGYVLGPDAGVADERAVVAAGGLVRIHEDRVGPVPHGLERELIVVVVVLGPPQVDDGLVGREEVPDHAVDAAVALGDDRSRAGLDEALAEVVGPLLGDAEGRGRVLGLGVARGVAEVVQEDDGVGRHADRRQRRLAVVLGFAVTVVRRRVQPQAIHLGVGRVSRVRARPAVAVADVEDDARAREGRLDVGPRGVRAVDLDHVRRVLDGRRVRRFPVGDVLRRLGLYGAYDDDDLGRREGRPARGRRRGRGRRASDRHGGGRDRRCRQHSGEQLEQEQAGEVTQRVSSDRTPAGLGDLVLIASLAGGRRSIA